MEQSKTNSFVIWVIHYLCLVSLESWARVTTPPWIMFKIWWVIRTTAQKQKSSCQQPKYLGKLWAKNLSLKLLKRKNSHVTNDKKVFFKASCHEIFKSNKLLFSFLKSHLSSKKQSSYIYTGPYSLQNFLPKVSLTLSCLKSNFCSKSKTEHFSFLNWIMRGTQKFSIGWARFLKIDKTWFFYI